MTTWRMAFVSLVGVSFSACGPSETRAQQPVAAIPGIVLGWQSVLEQCQRGPASGLQYARVLGGLWPVPLDFVVIASESGRVRYVMGSPASPHELGVSRVFMGTRMDFENHWQVERPELKLEPLAGTPFAFFRNRVSLSPEYSVDIAAIVSAQEYVVLWGPIALQFDHFMRCYDKATNEDEN